MASNPNSLVATIQEEAHELTGTNRDYDPLMQQIGDAQFALLGEASHGTHEFYQVRADITKLLIKEKGYTAVAVEADWPDAYRINRYVRGEGGGANAHEALSDFKRFPLWMWRNTVVLEFIEWLREHNDSLPEGQPKVGFYGVDLYSLYTSIEAVLNYLEEADPEGAQRARYRYGCFEHFGEDSQAYGYSASFGLTESCEEEAVNQLVELQRRAGEMAAKSERISPDEQFYAEQNARLVKNAEEYYRSMFRGRVLSWNLRDRHMAETLDELVAHLGQRIKKPKIAVWAHNSHLGDARATDMGAMGEWNVGQLVRQQYGEDARLIGFTTYTGTVTAASEWDQPAQLKRVRPGMPGSYEALFHEVGLPRFLLNLQGERIKSALRGPRLERAIGVIYLPETERVSHYFNARLSEQFDTVIHIDETRALEPLDLTAGWEEKDKVPETYPTGL